MAPCLFPSSDNSRPVLHAVTTRKDLEEKQKKERKREKKGEKKERTTQQCPIYSLVYHLNTGSLCLFQAWLLVAADLAGQSSRKILKHDNDQNMGQASVTPPPQR